MPSFGDHVRVRSSAETDDRGLAGRIGQVMGFTTPSMGYVTDPIIGAVTEDIAVAVTLDGETTSRWFGPELLEFVDHAPGTNIGLAGQSWTREVDGTWTKDA